MGLLLSPDVCDGRQNVMFNSGKSFFIMADKHGGKVVGDAFMQKCFRILAQRLGVCAHMNFYHCAQESDRRGTIFIDVHHFHITSTVNASGVFYCLHPDQGNEQ